MNEVQRFFVEESRIPESRRSILSPSGKFALDVDLYTTGPNTWNYSRGVVTRVEAEPHL